MADQDFEQLDARYGEKMIEVRVRFWTNDIASGEDKVVAKNARCSGVVRMKKNSLHGISGGRAIPFNSLLEIPSAIEKTLIEHGIKLHLPKRMKKYIVQSAG